MNRPAAGWQNELPSDRLIAEVNLGYADVANLAAEVARVEANCDLFHFDVSDGHFTPTLTFSPAVVARVRQLTARPIHVHLLVAESILMPQIDQFAAAGADVITVPAESTMVVDSALSRIRQLGLVAGVALKADTSIGKMVRHLPRVSFVTLLGGDAGSADVLVRLQEAVTCLKATHTGGRLMLVSDTGAAPDTFTALRKAGAQSVVLGASAFA